MNKSNYKLSNLSSIGLEHTPSYAFALLSPPSTTWSAFDIDHVGVDDIVVYDVDDVMTPPSTIC